MQVLPYDVSSEAENLVVKHLRSRGVVPGRKGGWIGLLESMDLATSAGFGFTTIAKHKTAQVLTFRAGMYTDYKQWYEQLPPGVFPLSALRDDQVIPHFITSVKVKEEVSKRTKILRGDYRTFFCVPTFLIFEQAIQTDGFAETLTAATFMFKGEDMRRSIRELAQAVYGGAGKVFCVQGDASKLDRTLSKKILKRCFSIAQRLGFPVTPDIEFATLNPVVCYVNQDGTPMLAKFEGPHTSGYRLTTEFGGLSIFLVICDILIRAFGDIDHRDFFITGVGDDWTFISSKQSYCEALLHSWEEYGLDMKAWRIRDLGDWDFLGSKLVDTRWGIQPHWDLDKSAVKLAYREKRQSDFDYIMRVVSILQYNLFHEKFAVMYAYLKGVWDVVHLLDWQKAVVLNTVREIPDLYTRPQCGRSLGGTIKRRTTMSDGMDKSFGYEKKSGVPTIAASYESVRPLCSTDAGARWLETAVDPFHDRIVPVRGLPDDNKGNSIVQVVQRRLTISAPSGVTGKWDAQIFWSGDLNNYRASDGNLVYDIPSPAELGANVSWLPTSGSAYAAGGVEVVSGVMGADLSSGSAGVLYRNGLWPYTDGVDPTAVGSTFPSGGYRLVAGGIEIYDTTPELYRGGSLTCYRASQYERDQPILTRNQVGTSTATNMAARLRSGRVASAAQALIIPGSRTWRAPEGLYMPIRVNTDAGIQYPYFGHIIAVNPVDSISNQTSMGPFANGGTNAPQQTLGSWFLPTKTQSMGAVLTGLDNNATFDIVVKYVIESFPSSRDVSLITLATPSPVEDEEALMSYKRLVEELPIGVPVIENATGTWLKRAMNAMKYLGKNAAKIYRYAEPALKVVAAAPGVPPQAQAAAKIALVGGMGARVIASEVKKAKKEKKKKTKGKQQLMLTNSAHVPRQRVMGKSGANYVIVD